eukprot:TRINITY_DN186_c2_g1_i1.p1 TRINITY_DN186_c2_g1~~TRINITY_DN186_c2_g1_i1.p1  ORF type:complete len:486 (+),score=188.01 TRINITY_DN186_c2_g1_i1:78-1460(+)
MPEQDEFADLSGPDAEAAAARIQAVQRGRAARKEAAERKAGGVREEDEPPPGPQSPSVHGGVLPGGAVLHEGCTSPRPERGTLVKDVIITGLRCLGPTDDGTSLAFLRCDLSGLSLRNIDAIKQYTHLRELNLAHNQLEDLAAVGSLPHIVSLNAPRNRLRRVLEAIPHGLTLQTVDLSHNLITKIPDLSRHRFLKVLRLDGNQISDIAGVNRLECLRELSLRGNRLKCISGLEGSALLRLFVRDNCISDVRGLAALSASLEELDLSGNEVSGLGSFAALRRLRVLDAGRNHISSPAELSELSGLQFLRELTLRGNPVADQRGSADAGAGSDTASDIVCADDDDATPDDAAARPVELPKGIEVPGGSTLGKLLGDHVLGPPLATKTEELGAALLFRYRVLFTVPQLTLLDGEPVTGAEKTKALNVLGGADQESRLKHELEHLRTAVSVLPSPTGETTPAP